VSACILKIEVRDGGDGGGPIINETVTIVKEDANATPLSSSTDRFGRAYFAVSPGNYTVSLEGKPSTLPQTVHLPEGYSPVALNLLALD